MALLPAATLLSAGWPPTLKALLPTTATTGEPLGVEEAVDEGRVPTLSELVGGTTRTT